MDILSTLFSFDGRIGRSAYVAGLVATLGVAGAIVLGSFQLLLPASRLLAPFGVNAGIVQTGLFVFVGVLALWIMTALTIKRLRDGWHPTQLAPLGFLPVAALSVAEGALTIRPVLDVPTSVAHGVMYVCGGLALSAIALAVLTPSRAPHATDDNSPEATAAAGRSD